MSQQPTTVFKRPTNLNTIQDVLESGSDMMYSVCTNKAKFHSNQPSKSPEEEAYSIEYFGNWRELLGREQPFRDFVLTLRSECGALSAGLTIWVTTDLNTPPELVDSHKAFLNAMDNYHNAFLRDPSSHWIMYFFVQFTNMPVDNHVALGDLPSNNIETYPPDNGTSSDARLPRVNTSQGLKNRVNTLKVAVGNVPGTVKDLISPRQPEEPSTVLTRLADDIEQEHYLDSLLPKTNSVSPFHQPAIDAYQADTFRSYCGLFPHIDPNQPNNNRSITFKNSLLAVTPHQYTRACQILFQNGGLLSSEMGTGKSFVILCAVVIRALLCESKRRAQREHDEVQALAGSSRKGSAKRLEHLPCDAPSGRGLKCPTQRALDCVCWCVPDGPTRQRVASLKPGGALIHVPSSSMPGWIEILENCKFSRMAYNFTVLYAGPPLSSRLEPNLDFLRSIVKMGAALREDHPGGTVNERDLTWFSQPTIADPRSMAPETYIFVTSHTSTKLKELYKWEVKDLSPAPQRAIFPPGGLYAFSIGLTFVDEAHKVLSLDSPPMQLAQVHRHVLPSATSTAVSDLWLVTGTPFGGQMKHLTAAIGFLAPDRAKDAMELLKAHEAIGSATTKAHFEALFHKVFGNELVIRDDVDTTFRGHLITDIQKVRPEYISRRIPNSQLQPVQIIINTKVTVGPRNAYFETLEKLSQNTQLLYLLSTFPSAAKALQDSPNSVYLDLDVRRLIRLERSTTGESLAGNKNLRSLAEQLARGPRSPKLQYCLDELDRMAKDVTQRPTVEPAAGNVHIETDQTQKKMVIITPTVFTAVMMYLILARFHPRSGPLLYHEDLKQSQRSEVLRRFNSLRKRDGPWRCLIAPAAVAAEALNLQIANRLILTSPLLNTHQESQALARVNRMGQTLKVHLKILLHEDSPIDRIIIAHRAGMKFKSDPFNVVEEVISVVNREKQKSP